MEPNNQPDYMNRPLSPESPVAPSGKKVGPVVAILVVILVIIIAALYLFASRINAPVTPESAEVQPVTNNSDEVDQIFDDLNASTQGLDNQNF